MSLVIVVVRNNITYLSAGRTDTKFYGINEILMFNRHTYYIITYARGVS